MNRINHLAVLVSVVAHQILGYLWYSAAPWARARLEALGRPLSDLNAVDPAALAADILCWLLGGYVIAWLASKTDSTTAGRGAMLGGALWLGVGLAAIVPHYMFAGIPPTVIVIDAANMLVALLTSGAIIGGWRKKAA